MVQERPPSFWLSLALLLLIIIKLLALLTSNTNPTPSTYIFRPYKPVVYSVFYTQKHLSVQNHSMVICDSLWHHLKIWLRWWWWWWWSCMWRWWSTTPGGEHDNDGQHAVVYMGTEIWRGTFEKKYFFSGAWKCQGKRSRLIYCCCSYTRAQNCHVTTTTEEVPHSKISDFKQFNQIIFSFENELTGLATPTS